MSNLRVFGSKSYVHIPDHQRKKLQKKSRMCIFLGYRKGTKGFKLYNPSAKVLIRSRHVVFDEEKFHEFHKEQSLKPNSEQLPFDSFIVRNADDNANRNDVDDQQNAAANNIPEPKQHDQPVRETYEKTFMRNVENLNPQRQRRPPARFDEELYNTEELYGRYQ